MKVQARATGQISRRSLAVIYGKDWEDCEGSEGLGQAECELLIKQWRRMDRETAKEFGYSKAYPHEYRIVEDWFEE